MGVVPWIFGRGVVAAAACLSLLFAAISCDRQHASQTQVTEVRLGYFANLTHAQAVLGVSSGEFAKAIEPATLTTQVFNAGPSLIEALLAGQIDIGYVGPGPALNAQERTHGQGIRVIAGAAANGVLIVASDASGIRTMQDLAGKRVATPQQGNTQDIAARHFALSVLKQPDASNVIPIANAEQVGMMTRNQIDAAWAAGAVGIPADRASRRARHRRRKGPLARQGIHPHRRRHHAGIPLCSSGCRGEDPSCASELDATSPAGSQGL